jgi:protein gp37
VPLGSYLRARLRRRGQASGLKRELAGLGFASAGVSGTYQVLTKRAERLEELAPHLPWAPHIWMGVSVENSDYQYRIDHLRRIGAAVKFLSLEPLLGPLERLDLAGIDWAIAGGESGPNARPMPVEWVRSIRDQCKAAQVAFHFKQWGGVNKKRTGRTLDGRTWDEQPKRRAPLKASLFDLSAV